MTRLEAISVLERVAHTESKWPGTEDTLAALDMAISVLRQQDQERNAPLTLDELRQMDGEPVWIVAGDVSWWDIVSFSVQDWLYLARGEELRYSMYGEWLAYRHKPEEEADHES